MGSMNLTYPTVGASSGTWGTMLNTAIAVLEEHDHTSGNGVQVPTAGINIDANLSFGGFAATSLTYTAFGGVTTTSAANASVFRNSANNELTWKTTGGVAVQITNGTGLNTSLLGGITGDYTTTSADVEYVDAEKAYEFKQAEGPDFWAKLKTGDILLHETASGITTRVTLKSPGTLASNYDWIFPTGLPGSTSLLTLSSAGQVAATLTPPTVTALTATGAISGATISGTTSVTTAEGDVRHGNVTVEVPCTIIRGATVGNLSGVTAGADAHWTGGTATASLVAKFSLKAGDRVKTVAAWVSDNSGAASVDFAVYRLPLSTGTAFGTGVTQVGTTQSSANSANYQKLTVTAAGAGQTVATDESWFGFFTLGDASSATFRFYALFVTYDRP